MNQSPKDPLRTSDSNIDYKSLYELNTDGILTINVHGQIYNGNKTIEQLSGYKIDELKCKNFLDYVIDEDKEEASDCFQMAINDASKECRFTFIHKTGEPIPCIVKFIPMEVTDIDKGLFLVIKDVRLFDQLSSKYRESQLNFKIIAENVQDVIILMDDQKNYLYVSPSSKTMFGFDPKKINQEKEPFFNIHPDDISNLANNFRDAMQTGKTFNVTLKALHEEKGWVWTHIMGTPVFDENNLFRHMVLVARDITLHKEHEERLTYLAFHDALTGLPNRRYFENQLKQSIDKLNIEGQPFTLVVFDIDDFKLINDTYGHDVGDQVIKEFATRIKTIIGQDGIVARLGGDEFVAILYKISTKVDVEKIINRIQQETVNEIVMEKQSVTITSSIGATICTKKDMDNSNFFNSADVALYNVKEKGKNKFHINYS
ncbi:sensor domain-containing diguanylate cyclase [Lysinibacillus antri]|uniref:Diguanylate cyclase n=1 Tax=Lysinibacillus antri TaxID=2498145 RepID=A0A3S0R8G2_9BACI|nr:sensor domain-containing diguanylate cyclase [Lysinibacillus antri]RUL56558.1 diguanylate cyclase [Lysinibacillus antri]